LVIQIPVRLSRQRHHGERGQQQAGESGHENSRGANEATLSGCQTTGKWVRSPSRHGRQQSTALTLALPLSAVFTAHPGGGDSLVGQAFRQCARQPLLHVALTVVDRVVHHIAAGTIFLGGVSTDDARKRLQRDTPDPDHGD
nr:hypothetical protein [Tanacetum cinerariifolium]